jgi:LacI family transcriptional regulator/LacI family purine nucleotide synthesis repressor
LRTKAATIDDVAARAQVSRMAVSVVLNGSRSGTRVSAATRERTLTAAGELGYRRNGLARSLKRGRTNIVGFYRYFAPGPLSAFHAEIISGLEEGCNAAHMDLLIHGTFHKRPHDDLLAGLLDRRIDGLIILVFPRDPLVAPLAESRFPVVALADAIPGIPSVVVDDVGGGRQMAAHLHERGHRNILYLSLWNNPVSMVRRFEAFQREAAAAPDWGIPDWDGDAMRTLFGHPEGERPTAVACWADVAAETLLAKWERSGVRFPDHVALISFDGIPTNGVLPTRLTTVEAPWREVAHTAARILADRIEGKEVLPETTLPVSLRVGITT